MNRSNQADKAPNFFIVGAPKCGTSAMFHYLEKHPRKGGGGATRKVRCTFVLQAVMYLIGGFTYQKETPGKKD